MVVEDEHSFFPQGGHDVIQQALLRPFHEVVGELPDLGKLLGGCSAVGRSLHHALSELQLDAAYSHHKELVEVRAEDCDELESLEQWQRRVLRFFQNPLLETKQAQLAVQVQIG